MDIKNRLFSLLKSEKFILIVANILIIIVFSSLNENYFSVKNFINILTAAALIGIVAVGHTYLIIAGQNDLSPGSLAALSGVVVALLLSYNVPISISIILTILVAVLVGLFNAFMVNKIKLQPFIATLVTQSVVRGFAFIICEGKPIQITNRLFIDMFNFRILNMPISVWAMVFTFIIFGFILARTKFGRKVYAIGGSTEAARLAGIKPDKTITSCFVLIAVLTAIGGILFVARMNSGQPAANVNLEFDSITAVILGGTSFLGGVGSMGGTVLGVFLIQAFNTGLTMIYVPTFWHYVARGGLLLFALTFDYIRKEQRKKELLEAIINNQKL